MVLNKGRHMLIMPAGSLGYANLHHFLSLRVLSACLLYSTILQFPVCWFGPEEGGCPS